MDHYCQCTTKTLSPCPICNKKIAFINSPFGSIPSLDFIESFFEDMEEKFKEKTQEIIHSVNSKLLSEWNQEKKHFLLLEQSMKDRISEYESLIKDLSDNFEQNLEKKMSQILENQKKLKFFTNKTFTALKKSLEFLSGIIVSILQMSNEFQLSKKEYLDTLAPQIAELIDSFDTLKKILPKMDFLTEELETKPVEEIFSQNKQLISNKTLLEKKSQFEHDLSEISIKTLE